jgi:hypothetical protein
MRAWPGGGRGKKEEQGRRGRIEEWGFDSLE